MVCRLVGGRGAVGEPGDSAGAPGVPRLSCDGGRVPMLPG